MLLLVSMLGCQESQFSAEKVTARAADATATGTEIDVVYLPNELGNPNTSKPTLCQDEASAKLLQFDRSNRLVNTPNSKGSLEVVILLDVAESMQPYIDVVKNNILIIANELAQLNLDIKIGGIDLKDSIVASHGLTSDFGVFQQFISRQYALGGDDLFEAGLVALGARARVLSSGDSEAVKVLLLVTDVPSHNGLGTSSDCGVYSSSQINSMFNSQDFYYYHATGTEVSRAAKGYVRKYNGFETAREQFEDISRGVNKLLSVEESTLPWPFNKASLLENFKTSISNKVTTGTKICVSQEATIIVNGQPKVIWSADDYQSVLSIHRSGQRISVNNPLKKIKSTSDARLEINRCCHDSKIENPSFSNCSQTKTATLPFSI